MSRFGAPKDVALAWLLPLLPVLAPSLAALAQLLPRVGTASTRTSAATTRASSATPHTKGKHAAPARNGPQNRLTYDRPPATKSDYGLHPSAAPVLPPVSYP